jgi:hypothetical protein
VNQRKLFAEPEGTPEPPPTLPEVPAPPPEPPPVPRSYAPVRSSSDELWERRLLWLRARERAEAAQRSDPPPPAP